MVKAETELMTVPKAAKEIGKHKMTLYRWIDRGKIEAVEHGGILFIKTSDVERLKSVGVNSG